MVKEWSYEFIKEKYLKNELLYNCIILAILFFVNCFAGWFSYVAFTFLAIITLFSSIPNGFSYLVFTVPFSGVGYKISGFYYGGIIIAFLIKFYLKMFIKDKKKIDKKIIISFCLFLTYLLMPFGEYTGYYFVKLSIIVLIILVFYLLSKYPKEFNIRFNLNVLSLSLFISSFYFLNYFISEYLQSITSLDYAGEYLRFQALLLNPNVLAVLSEICLSLLTYFILSKKYSWVEIFSFVVFSVLGLSTFSKNFIVLFSIMLFIIIIYYLIKFPFKGICIISGISLFIILLVAFKREMVLTYLHRFINFDGISEMSFFEIMEKLTTARYGIWVSYINYMFEYPLILLFGGGLGAKQIIGKSCHNIYIAMLYQLGIFGIILLIFLIYSMISSFKREFPKRINKMIFVPILIIVILTMAEDLFMYIYV